MEPRIPIDRDKIIAFCQKWKIIEFSLFGSVLTEEFNTDSDVDVMVSFAEDAKWGICWNLDMEPELKAIVGRKVDINERRAVERNDNYIFRRSILENDRRYTKDDAFLLYMLKYSKEALERTIHKTYEQHLAEKDGPVSLAYNLTCLVSKASKVSNEFRQQHEEIPWDMLFSAGERLRIPSSDDQDIKRAWEMATNTIPRIIELITPLIPPEDDPRPKPEVDYVSPLVIYRASTVEEAISTVSA